MRSTQLHIYAGILVAAFLCSGCTAMFIADQVVPKEPQHLPDDIRIDVPYIEQTDNYCGPASLAMVANYYGINATPNEIASLVYIPERKGTLQIEMTAATRNLDLVPYTMQMDLEALRAEINAERPVIVLRNLALDVYPIWHYSVLLVAVLMTNIFYCTAVVTNIIAWITKPLRTLGSAPVIGL